MWAQMTTICLKAERDSGHPRLYEALPLAECAGTGFLRAAPARDQKDPAIIVHLVLSESADTTLAPAPNPSRQKDLEDMPALVADISEGPEFVGFDVTEDALL